MGHTLEERIAYAEGHLASARAALARADAKHEAANEMGGGIPGFGGSGNQRAARQVRSALDSSYRSWREATERVQKWSDKLARLKAQQAEIQRLRLTRDDVAGATHVRTRFGWHKVARVNKTTVSVETGYSWTDRYPFDEIHEARTL